jgi:hypothetical protein
MMLEPQDMFMTMQEVASYVSKTVQSLYGYRSRRLLTIRTRGRVRLDDFNKFLAKKFPRLARLDTVADLDAWRAKNSTPTKAQ